jgi:hypothetical protein
LTVSRSPAWIVAALLGLAACVSAAPDVDWATSPVKADEMSAVGAYLAGRHADRIRDVRSAGAFMDQVVMTPDAGIAMKRRAFLLRLEDGRFDDALPLAEEVVDTLDTNAPVANIFLAVEAARAEDFSRAGTRCRTTA